MEQTPKQSFDRKRRIRQFRMTNRRTQNCNMLPVWIVQPNVQTFTAVLAIRQILQQQSASYAMPLLRLHRHAQHSRQLL